MYDTNENVVHQQQQYHLPPAHSSTAAQHRSCYTLHRRTINMNTAVRRYQVRMIYDPIPGTWYLLLPARCVVVEKTIQRQRPATRAKKNKKKTTHFLLFALPPLQKKKFDLPPLCKRCSSVRGAACTFSLSSFTWELQVATLQAASVLCRCVHTTPHYTYSDKDQLGRIQELASKSASPR